MTEKDTSKPPRDLRISKRPRTGRLAKKHAQQHFTDAQAAEYIERWHRNESVSVMAREAGVSRRTMQDLCTGLSYLHLHEARRKRLGQDKGKKH